jgi:hypothetical protein
VINFGTNYSHHEKSVHELTPARSGEVVGGTDAHDLCDSLTTVGVSTVTVHRNSTALSNTSRWIFAADKLNGWYLADG